MQGSKWDARPRDIRFNLKRKEEGDYWPRLLKTSVKHRNISVDFGLWKDEDPDEDEAQGKDMDFGGGGMDLSALQGMMGGMLTRTRSPTAASPCHSSPVLSSSLHA